MKIVIFSWRDPKNPLAGGAEQITLKYAEKWVKHGYKVLWLSSVFKDSTKVDFVNGVKIVRLGRNLNVSLFNLIINFIYFYLSIIVYYLLNLRGRIDFVVDQIHGIPFLTPLYVKEKKVLMICEIADQIWYKMFIFPINIIGIFLERNLLRLYRSLNVWTISYSTKSDLLGFGFKQDFIKVIPLGINNTPIASNLFPPSKFNSLTILFVGRLVKMKGIEDAILCVSHLVDEYPDIMLYVVGKGNKDYEDFLKNFINNLNVGKHVKLLGYINDELKNEYFAKSHIFIHPSVKEGFGLTVLEAGANGTPSVVYNIHGLKDLIIHNIDGVICTSNTPQSMAESVSYLYKSQDLYCILQKNIWEKSKNYTWQSIPMLIVDD